MHHAEKCTNPAQSDRSRGVLSQPGIVTKTMRHGTHSARGAEFSTHYWLVTHTNTLALVFSRWHSHELVQTAGNVGGKFSDPNVATSEEGRVVGLL